MRKFYFVPLFCTLLFISFPSFSQNSLQGIIVNQKKEPVAFANVVLLQAKDSVSVVKGVVSEEDGSFLLNDIADSNYVLQVSFVGYENYLKKIKVKGNENLGKITLTESQNNLDEVTVTGKRPTIKKSVDRLTFNVENSTLSTADSWEILKHTPGVIVSQGQLLIKNRPAVVYINDRKVYLTQQELQQLLQGFSGNNVKSVEVITNPPAKYDAEGGSILNIVTSKTISIGYKGDVNSSATIAKVPKYTFGTSQYYKNDWLNFYAGYTFSTRNDLKEDTGKIVFFNRDGTIDSRWYNDFRKDSYKNSHSINTIMDFTLSEKSSLSLSANLMFTPKENSNISGRTEIHNPQDRLDSLYTTNSFLKNEVNNLMFNADYSAQLGENSSLSVKANYINYTNDQAQDLRTNYFDPNETLLSQSSFNTLENQNTDIYTGQLDISSTIGSVPIETGLKYSGINSDSGLDFYNTSFGTQDYNSVLSDQFNYKENIYAGYFSLSKDWEKWSLKTGLRGEYTDVAGTSNSLGLVNTQQYFSLFPSFYLLNTPSENNSYSLQYSRRITRPRFQSLNPFRYFLNENNYQIGNPNLRAGITDKVTLDYTYKNKLSFDAYWERTNHSTAVLPFQDNQNHTFRTITDNVDSDTQYSFDISYYSYLNNWWYMYAYASFYYLKTDFYAVESGNQLVTNDVYSTYLLMQNYFTLSKDRTFTATLTGFYVPAFIAGAYRFDEPQYNVTLGLRKTFFGGRLETSVDVEDIFNSVNIPMSSKYLNQDNSFFAMPESRYVRFGLRYKFGNFKLKDNNRSQDAEESERLKTKEIL